MTNTTISNCMDFYRCSTLLSVCGQVPTNQQCESVRSMNPPSLRHRSVLFIVLTRTEQHTSGWVVVGLQLIKFPNQLHLLLFKELFVSWSGKMMMMCGKLERAGAGNCWVCSESVFCLIMLRIERNCRSMDDSSKNQNQLADDLELLLLSTAAASVANRLEQRRAPLLSHSLYGQ